jgi:2-polyprenyl-6-methoxyphenol hydroxylase-like FAD-dependent oxidoreductase
MQLALLERIQHLSGESGVKLFMGMAVKSISLPEGDDNQKWARIECDNGDTFETRLVVGADGAKSAVKSAVNIGTCGFGYNQLGLIATVVTNESVEEKTAWQRYLPTGISSYKSAANMFMRCLPKVHLPYCRCPDRNLPLFGHCLLAMLDSSSRCRKQSFSNLSIRA